MTRVEVSIEQLVLHGFAPRDRERIGAAVEHELARLFAETPGLPGLRGEQAPFVDGGAFDVARDTPADGIGAQIARAVFTACGGGSGT